ncbi:LysE family translocator [Enterovirga sp.]|jgi:threonine/homoserine/homoserine lactone efflux protein|uniref:LysE family translocator n=1 Tax=Enterovirga sp. TaxID=2026350 RepID=UPI0026348B56|nr:LysE family translocator [Enterovirga sp.]MDB5592105.1 LysE family translocator [Enterovirga sp.]
MFALPDPSVLLAYTAACLVLFITPGPDMSLFLSRTLSGGRRHGMAAMLGAMTGCLIHTLVAALGLSALIAASQTGFAVLKIVGALYLLWLAWDALKNGSALRLKQEAVDTPVWRTFLVGIGINLTNPKIVLFFVTFLPQFVDPADPHAAGQLVGLGLYFVLITSPPAAVMILGAERLIGLLARRPRVMRAVDVLFASVFALFALRIAVAQSR